MTRIAVLDTNIIVSAGINRNGAPAQIVIDWALEGLLQLVTCARIIHEYRDVLGRTKFRHLGYPPIWLDVLIQDSLLLPDPAPWPNPLPDPDDAVFLALAARAGAVLVTGNLADYPVVSRSGARILRPAEFLLELQSAS